MSYPILPASQNQSEFNTENLISNLNSFTVPKPDWSINLKSDWSHCSSSHADWPMGEKVNYECSECGAKFTSRGPLKRHQNALCKNPDNLLTKTRNTIIKHNHNLIQQRQLLETETRTSNKYLVTPFIKIRNNFESKSYSESPASLSNHFKLSNVDRILDHSESIPSTQEAMIDSNTSANSTTLRCEICNKLCRSQVSLLRHTKQHQNPHSLFACDICGKTFKISSGLKQHMHIHSSNKPYSCLHCQKSYTQYSNLCRHKRMSRDCQRKVICPDCGLEFTNGKTFETHKSHCLGSSSNNKPSSLTITPPSKLSIKHTPTVKSFNAEDLISETPSLPTSNIPIDLSLPKSTSSKTTTTTPMLLPFSSYLSYFQLTYLSPFTKYLLHNMKPPCLTNELPRCTSTPPSSSPASLSKYHCQLCLKTFPRAANLNRHIRTHTGEQPYKCAFCNKCFSISSNMQRHVRNIHNRERPYKCTKCDAVFDQLNSLDKHIREGNCGPPFILSSNNQFADYDDEEFDEEEDDDEEEGNEEEVEIEDRSF